SHTQKAVGLCWYCLAKLLLNDVSALMRKECMRGGAGLGTQERGRENRRQCRDREPKTSLLMNTDRTDQKQIETNQRGAVKLGNTKKIPFWHWFSRNATGSHETFPTRSPSADRRGR